MFKLYKLPIFCACVYTYDNNVCDVSSLQICLVSSRQQLWVGAPRFMKELGLLELGEYSTLSQGEKFSIINITLIMNGPAAAVVLRA